ncbi:hypothetical protein [Marinobacter salicampi]|uniref:hypothetical protein n=1 Tax=Marinobacter salicampi TaxID=435907 RepID=UPI001F5EB89A|nr:hypothetical protein [Marinobacter salicampi]
MSLTRPILTRLRVRSLLAYLALAAGTVAFIPGMGVTGALAVSVAVIMGWGDLRRITRMLSVLVAIGFALALATEPGALVLATGNMTRLAALIISVMLLSAILSQSPDIRAISRSLFGGRALGRYYRVGFGTAFLSLPLNFGAVAVVSTLVGEEVREGGDSAKTRNVTRSLLRGFGTAPMCSPLSISVALTLTLVPGLHSVELLSLSLPIALVFLLLSARYREPEVSTREPALAGAIEWAPWLRFALTIGSICAATLALSASMGVSYSRAVTLSCLAAVILAALYRLLIREKVGLPSLAPVSNELVIVGGSAFLGSLISTLALAYISDGQQLAPWAYPVAAMLVPWAYFLAGMIGVNPIITGTLVGGVLGPMWPAESVLALGLVMVVSWGITASGTPYSATSLLMERLSGYSAWHAALHWNRMLSVFTLLLVGLAAAGMTMLMG